MLDTNNAQDLAGATVYDNDGDKIGKVAQVYLSNRDNEVEWLTVTTGLFGTRESFLPAREATFTNNEIRVPVSKAQVKDAPKIDADGQLDGAEEQELYRYYSLDGGDTEVQVDTDDTVGHDTSGRTTDDAMTRAKEELQVGTQTTQAGRARLRKYVTTEQQTVTVPVSHEEVRIEREPITDANRGDAHDGPEISEEEHEVTLHAEQPVLTTTTTPVERVSLGTETVTEDQQVTGEVREEHIDVDTDGQSGTTDRR